MLAFAAVPPLAPAPTRRAPELSITVLATGLAVLLVLLVALSAARLLRRRAFLDSDTRSSRRSPTRLPDPWRESARRLERANPTGDGPDSPRARDEEPFQ